MSMVPSAAWRALSICLVSVALASCCSAPSRNQPDSQDEVAEPGLLAGEQAHQPPTSLRVVNETLHVVVLTSADGHSTASVEAGKTLQLASRRVCRWLPLTATTANGRFLDKFTKPCHGQTWTITDSGQVTKPGHSYAVAVAPEVSDRHTSSVQAFIRFAATPTPSTAAAVPFARSGVTVALDAEEKVIPREDLADNARWLLSDKEGVGTTSALFVISNSIRNAQPGKPLEFVVTPRQMPLCDQVTHDPPTSSSARLFVALGTPGTSGGCAPGFRITLDMEPDGTIRAVRLAVQVP